MYGKKNILDKYVEGNIYVMLKFVLYKPSVVKVGITGASKMFTPLSVILLPDTVAIPIFRFLKCYNCYPTISIGVQIYTLSPICLIDQ